MGTQGKHWERRDIKWTAEIQDWLKERCPVREHGYTKRKEVLDELNATFGTDFTEKAFVTHCYESGIQLGLASSNSNIPRGELSVMAELGHTAEMTREEREICLLRARIAIAKGTLIGRDEAAAMRRKAYYERVKDTPEFKAARAAYAHRKHLERMADPAQHEEMVRKQQAYRKRRRT